MEEGDFIALKGTGKLSPGIGSSQTNIGLGNGTALDIFNNNIWAWRRVDQKGKKDGYNKSYSFAF